MKIRITEAIQSLLEKTDPSLSRVDPHYARKLPPPFPAQRKISVLEDFIEMSDALARQHNSYIAVTDDVDQTELEEISKPYISHRTTHIHQQHGFYSSLTGNAHYNEAIRIFLSKRIEGYSNVDWEPPDQEAGDALRELPAIYHLHKAIARSVREYLFIADKGIGLHLDKAVTDKKAKRVRGLARKLYDELKGDGYYVDNPMFKSSLYGLAYGQPIDFSPEIYERKPTDTPLKRILETSPRKVLLRKLLYEYKTGVLAHSSTKLHADVVIPLLSMVDGGDPVEEASLYREYDQLAFNS